MYFVLLFKGSLGDTWIGKVRIILTVHFRWRLKSKLGQESSKSRWLTFWAELLVQVHFRVHAHCDYFHFFETNVPNEWPLIYLAEKGREFCGIWLRKMKPPNFPQPKILYGVLTKSKNFGPTSKITFQVTAGAHDSFYNLTRFRARVSTSVGLLCRWIYGTNYQHHL